MGFPWTLRDESAWSRSPKRRARWRTTGVSTAAAAVAVTKATDAVLTRVPPSARIHA